jgi:hypothetical protein
MLRIAAALIAMLVLAGCDAVNTMTEGFKHAKAVETDLEGATGVKPNVGFNWKNGSLVQVTVQFPRLVESKSLHDLAAAARESIGREFQQTPESIVLAFAVPK